jgi:DNA-directed RNA polymerase specialized sigma24 family protein
MSIHSLDTYYTYPELVRRAVCSGIRKLNQSFRNQDFEDMLQLAWMRVWQYAQDREPAYQFQTARSAVYNWFFRFDLEKRATGDELVPHHHSLEEMMETETGELNLAETVIEDRVGNLPIGENELVEMLAQTRVGYHSKHEWQRARSRSAAAKDARIITLLAQGYTNFGIAQEMGISPDQVRARRSRIRKALSSLIPNEIP